MLSDHTAGYLTVVFFYSFLTWLPPLFGLTNTRMGFMSGEGRGFNMNGRHLDSWERREAISWVTADFIAVHRWQEWNFTKNISEIKKLWVWLEAFFKKNPSHSHLIPSYSSFVWKTSAFSSEQSSSGSSGVENTEKHTRIMNKTSSAHTVNINGD